MRELASRFKIFRNYHREQRLRIVEQHTVLADVYRAGSGSRPVLHEIELLEEESRLLARTLTPLWILAHERINPSWWVKTEGDLRRCLYDLYTWYENQKVPHPQVVLRQYPAEWVHKKQ